MITYGALVLVAVLSTWLVTVRVVSLEARREGLRGFTGTIEAVESDLALLTKLARDPRQLADIPLPVIVYNENGTVIANSLTGYEVSVNRGQDGIVTVTMDRRSDKGIERSNIQYPRGILLPATGSDSLFVVPLPPADSISIATNLDTSGLTLMRVLGVSTAVLALIALVGISNGIFRPVRELEAVAGRIASGDFDARATVLRNDELGSLAVAMNEMASRLGEAERLRRSVASEIAHELRTPLTNIKVQIEAIKDGLVDPTEGLSALAEDSGLLERLVEDLHTLTLADSGQLPLHPEPVGALPAITRAVRAVDPDGGKRIGVESPEDALVHVDPVRFQQVLRNLLHNALQHSPSPGTVSVRCTESDGRVFFEISDSGPGIPVEFRDLVFERFYRVDESRARKSGGTGLGLSIVRRITELSGGSVELVDSSAGALFRVTLPSV